MPGHNMHRRRLIFLIGILVLTIVTSYRQLIGSNFNFSLRHAMSIDSSVALDLNLVLSNVDFSKNKQHSPERDKSAVENVAIQMPSGVDEIETVDIKEANLSQENFNDQRHSVGAEENGENSEGKIVVSVSGGNQRIVPPEQRSHEDKEILSANYDSTLMHVPRKNHSDNIILTPCLKAVKHRRGLDTNENWINFKKSLDKYALFHRQQLEKIRSGDSNVRTFSYMCNNHVQCHGIGDQFYRIQQALLLAIASNRVLFLDWDKIGMKTFRHLAPNRIQWEFKQVIIDDVHIIRKLNGRKEYVRFMNYVNSNDQQHIGISTAFPVPFTKGLIRLFRCDEQNIFSKLSLLEILTGKHKVPHSLVQGELLRYLFSFSQDVLRKVNKAQKSMGMFNASYIGVHIRTGFYGTQYQENGHFNKMKIFRKEDTWYSTINCSLRLSDKSPDKIPLYLATDSYQVKQLSVKHYGNRVKSLNMTLQHVAIPYKNKAGDVGTLSGVDGFMATWIDFLLLARSEVLVHSISGFSTIAGMFCPVSRQYYTPKCSKIPTYTHTIRSTTR